MQSAGILPDVRNRALTSQCPYAPLVDALFRASGLVSGPLSIAVNLGTPVLLKERRLNCQIFSVLIQNYLLIHSSSKERHSAMWYDFSVECRSPLVPKKTIAFYDGRNRLCSANDFSNDKSKLESKKLFVSLSFQDSKKLSVTVSLSFGNRVSYMS